MAHTAYRQKLQQAPEHVKTAAREAIAAVVTEREHWDKPAKILALAEPDKTLAYDIVHFYFVQGYLP